MLTGQTFAHQLYMKNHPSSLLLTIQLNYHVTPTGDSAVQIASGQKLGKIRFIDQTKKEIELRPNYLTGPISKILRFVCDTFLTFTSMSELDIGLAIRCAHLFYSELIPCRPFIHECPL